MHATSAIKLWFGVTWTHPSAHSDSNAFYLKFTIHLDTLYAYYLHPKCNERAKAFALHFLLSYAGSVQNSKWVTELSDLCFWMLAKHFILEYYSLSSTEQIHEFTYRTMPNISFAILKLMIHRRWCPNILATSKDVTQAEHLTWSCITPYTY